MNKVIYLLFLSLYACETQVAQEMDFGTDQIEGLSDVNNTKNDAISYEDMSSTERDMTSTDAKFEDLSDIQSNDVSTDVVEAPPCDYPANSMWKGEIAQPDIDAPDFKKSIIDPTFGTTITKISTQSYHHYSKTQPWNSDGTMIFTSHNGYNIIDTSTFDIMNTPNLPTGERRWSTRYPDRLYYIEKTRLMTYDPTTDKRVLLHEFEQEGCDLIRLGPWEGNLSIDDKRVAIACRLRDTSDFKAFVYEIDTDTFLGTKLFPGKWGDAYLDWVSMSQSGEYVVIRWIEDGMISYRASDMSQVQVLTKYGSHGDLCVDEHGNDIYVQVVCGGNPLRDKAGIISFRLDNGNETIVLPPKGFVCSGHVSCRNYRRPGWAYISAEVHHELFAIKLDGSSVAQRFAHMHNDTLHPLAVPNPDGCKVMWGSDWSGSGAAYIAEQK